MIHVINIHWKRKTPHPDKPASGKSTYYARSKYLTNAINKSKRKFRRQFGNDLEITKAEQFNDPAQIL